MPSRPHRLGDVGMKGHQRIATDNQNNYPLTMQARVQVGRDGGVNKWQRPPTRRPTTIDWLWLKCPTSVMAHRLNVVAV